MTEDSSPRESRVWGVSSVAPSPRNLEREPPALAQRLAPRRSPRSEIAESCSPETYRRLFMNAEEDSRARPSSLLPVTRDLLLENESITWADRAPMTHYDDGGWKLKPRGTTVNSAGASFRPQPALHLERFFVPLEHDDVRRGYNDHDEDDIKVPWEKNGRSNNFMLSLLDDLDLATPHHHDRDRAVLIPTVATETPEDDDDMDLVDEFRMSDLPARVLLPDI